MRKQAPKTSATTGHPDVQAPTIPTTSSSNTSSSLASALSWGVLNFTSHNIKPAKLTLTPHHLFFLLSRMEDLSIPVGPMSVRLESIHAEPSPANYVSFLHQSQKPLKGRSDNDSLHSVSSIRSVMSGMSAIWSSFGLGSSSTSKTEKAKAAAESDLKYLYSAFTKIPCLRLAPDHRARLIRGYEEFPFDTAVPLHAFKNVQGLEVIDVDFRQFFGWDKLSENLVYLTVKRAKLDDPIDLITGIVLDDADRRRRRSTKTSTSPTIPWMVPSPKKSDLARSNSDPGSPGGEKYASSASPKHISISKDAIDAPRESTYISAANSSPNRPTTSRTAVSYRHVRTKSKMKRSGSGSSNSSEQSLDARRPGSTTNLAMSGMLSAAKWQRLKFLSLADNSLTSLSVESLVPLAGTLRSLDLSSNLFTEIPDSLASLVALQSLDLSNCMIESLHSLLRNPLPAITRLKLRSNRLRSIAGVERLPSLECLNLQDNKLSDPTEMARLTGMPYLREIWIKHNPFTRSHSGYRVTIFNLFRKASTGYTEDILIDNNGPSYSERKQLVERVFEPERPPGLGSTNFADTTELPMIHQNLSSPTRADVHGDKAATSHLNRSTLVSTESNVSTARRRRGPRRRIVDISKEEPTNNPILQKGMQADSVDRPRESLDSANSSQVEGTVRQDILQSGSPSDLQKDKVADEIISKYLKDRDWDIGSEAYRQKLEAVKAELGNNWLSVLGNRNWDAPSNAHPAHHPSQVTSPITPPLHRTANHAIASGGRSIG
ncbi:MAG: hypothetical protein Q9227_007271 [Pyrenula ochraceoflavens]